MVKTTRLRLIEILTSHNNDQRQNIKAKYKLLYDIELKDHIKIEVAGKLQEVLVSLLYTPTEYAVVTLHRSLNTFRPKSLDVIEILTTRNSFELRQIERLYKRKYNQDLNDDLKCEEYLSVSEVFIALVKSNRPADHQCIDNEQAYEDAKRLFEAGEAHFNSHDSEFINILCTRSFEQLRKTFELFADIAGKDIAEFIQTETSGYFEECLLAIVECVRDIQKYFAEHLYKNIQNPSIFYFSVYLLKKNI